MDENGGPLRGGNGAPNETYGFVGEEEEQQSERGFRRKAETEAADFATTKVEGMERTATKRLRLPRFIRGNRTFK